MKKLTYFFLFIPVLFLAFFYLLPLLKILGVGLVGGWQAFEGIDVNRVLGVVQFTIVQAAVSSALTILLGIPAAYLFYRYQFPHKDLLYMLTAVPFMLPTVVVASGFNGLAGPSGLVNTIFKILSGEPKPILEFTGTLAAILVAHVFYNTTVVIRMVRGSLERQDPSLVAAARTLGATQWQAFRWVTLPSLLPAAAASAFMVFFFDFTSFGVVLMLGGAKFSTLEVEIYNQTMRFLNLPYASLLSLIQVGFTAIFAVFYSRLSSSRSGASARIKWNIAHLPKTGAEKLAAGVGVSTLWLFFTLPVLALPVRSITNLEAIVRDGFDWQRLITVQHYVGLFFNPRDSYFYVPPFQALFNSLMFGGGTIALSLLIGLPTALIISRRASLQSWIEPLFILPLGTSSVTLGLGYLLFFNRPLWGADSLIASPWLLPFAHTAIALPFVLRNLLAGIQAIPPSYHQAARVLGASPRQILASIDLPILRGAIVRSAAFAFTISLGEFGATSLIGRPQYPTLPTAIYRLISQPGAANFGQAMALSTILFVLCAAGIYLIEREGANQPVASNREDNGF